MVKEKIWDPTAGKWIQTAPTMEEFTMHQAEMLSQELGKGASLVGIHDAGNLFAATTVEGALKEVFQSGNSRRIEMVNALLLIDPSLPITSSSSWAEIEIAVGMISTGKKWASGEFVNGNAVTASAVIRGLGFKPSYVTISFKQTSGGMSFGSDNFYLTSMYNKDSPELAFKTYVNGIIVSRTYAYRYNGAYLASSYDSLDTGNVFYEDGFKISTPSTFNEFRSSVWAWSAFE